VFPVSRPPFWFPVELPSNCALGYDAITSGDFGILKNKRRIVQFASKGDLRPLIQWSSSLSDFHKNNHPHHLHFRWRNSITGWTILKISKSFHHALMALGMRRSAMENSYGQLRYSRTTRVQLLHPLLFEGNYLRMCSCFVIITITLHICSMSRSQFQSSSSFYCSTCFCLFSWQSLARRFNFSWIRNKSGWNPHFYRLTDWTQLHGCVNNCI